MKLSGRSSTLKYLSKSRTSDATINKWFHRCDSIKDSPGGFVIMTTLSPNRLTNGQSKNFQIKATIELLAYNTYNKQWQYTYCVQDPIEGSQMKNVHAPHTVGIPVL